MYFRDVPKALTKWIMGTACFIRGELECIQKYITSILFLARTSHCAKETRGKVKIRALKIRLITIKCNQFATLSQKMHNILPQILTLYHPEYKCMFDAVCTVHHIAMC